MQKVTDLISNPFGLVMPERYAGPTEPEAVYGYGDANADFHVIGDRSSVHGGSKTGIPFTDSVAGSRLQRVLSDTGLLASEPEPSQSGTVGSDSRPALDPRNLFLSYLFAGNRPMSPAPRDYEALERYFDAELRAINAHILVPIGPRAIDHILESYTTQRRRFPDEIDDGTIHATEVRGRGFLVVPIREPADWTGTDEAMLVDRLNAIRNRDYRQTKGVATLVG